MTSENLMVYSHIAKTASREIPIEYDFKRFQRILEDSNEYCPDTCTSDYVDYISLKFKESKTTEFELDSKKFLSMKKGKSFRYFREYIL